MVMTVMMVMMTHGDGDGDHESHDKYEDTREIDNDDSNVRGCSTCDVGETE